MGKTQTTFGEVVRDETETTVYATGETLSAWARNPYSAWPCSVLATTDETFVVFDSCGDLVDVEHPGADDIPADELNAWASECLVRAGYPNHPAIR